MTYHLTPDEALNVCAAKIAKCEVTNQMAPQIFADYVDLSIGKMLLDEYDEIDVALVWAAYMLNGMIARLKGKGAVH